MTHDDARPFTRKRLFMRLFIALCLVGGLSAAFAAEELLMYAIVQQQDAELLAEAFTEETGIDVQLIRGSGGEIVSRVIAEGGAPRADVVLGGASSLHISMAAEGVLDSYVPEAGDYLPDGAIDPDGYWSGFYLTALGIGVNQDRFEQQFGDRPLPETWEDLADPDFAGEIVMTDPVASSTSYLFVQTQLQRLGWDDGWDYLADIAPLVGQFPTSGSAPPRMVGTGEYIFGVAFVHSLSRTIEQGFPVSLIVPPGTGGEVGAVSIIADGPNPEVARQFVEFMQSPKAQQLYAEQALATPLHPEVELPEAAVARDAIDMIEYDAALAGEQRDETLQRWSDLVD